MCPLLITFANSIDPNKVPNKAQNIRSDQAPICLTLMVFLLKNFWNKVNFGKKNSADDKSMPHFSACKVVDPKHGQIMGCSILILLSIFIPKKVNTKINVL